MSYTAILRKKALTNLTEAWLYYEEKQPGLGEKFLSSYQNKFDHIVRMPLNYSFILSKKQNLRAAKLNGFPYIIIYEVIADRIIIYTIHNTYLTSYKP